MSDEELANKIDWEGGPYEAIFGYGLYPEDCDNPETADLLREIRKIGEPLDTLFQQLPEPSLD